MIQLWIVVLVFYPIVWCLARISCKSCTFFTRMKEGYEYSAFFRAGIGSFIDLCLYAFLQASNASMENYVVATSTVCAIITLVWIMLFPFYILTTVNKHSSDHLKDETYLRKYGTLYSEFKTERFTGRNFLVVTIIRRAFICFSLVYLHDYTQLQLILIIFFNCGVLFYLIIIRPFQLTLNNVVETVCEAILVLCLCVISYYFNSGAKGNESSDIGWVIIIMFMTAIVIHMTLILRSMVMMLFETCKKLCGRKKNPIVPNKPGTTITSIISSTERRARKRGPNKVLPFSVNKPIRFDVNISLPDSATHNVSGGLFDETFEGIDTRNTNPDNS